MTALSRVNMECPNGPALAQTVLGLLQVRPGPPRHVVWDDAAGGRPPITVNLVPGGGGGSNNGVNVINLNCYAGTDADTARSGGGRASRDLDGGSGQRLDRKSSNGEALSRVCGQILYPNRAWLFSTGQDWLNAAGRPDWVNNVEHTDQDFVYTGCGALFLNYLAYQLNYEWPAIIGAGAANEHAGRDRCASWRGQRLGEFLQPDRDLFATRLEPAAQTDQFRPAARTDR